MSSCLAAAAVLLGASGATAAPPPAAPPRPGAPASVPAPTLPVPAGDPAGVPAPAPVLAPAPAPAAAPAPTKPSPRRLPACTASDDHTFPLATRIHGGPSGYRPGGGPGTWYLDLRNTTDRSCAGIHPVVVLVDEARALKPSQPRMEFQDGDRSHPVRFEATDADELIGAFTGEDDDFPGFTVGPGRTVTVKVRLAVAAGAEPNEVTAKAAVVQRRADDGDWVGQSNDYRFRIAPDAPDPAASTTASPAPATASDALAGTGVRRTYFALASTALLIAAGAGVVLLARRRR
ncbi:hypothetical protein [Streptomyces poriticola]|uniref:hypothetical protein n=1 Tax=Streptomyces poriticola TaxID=3120506 RepID=UPI002FCE5B18